MRSKDRTNVQAGDPVRFVGDGVVSLPCRLIDVP